MINSMKGAEAMSHEGVPIPPSTQDASLTGN